MASRQHLTVTQLTNYLKNLLAGDPVLQEVWVRGEISNFRRPSSGHMYFTLKDDGAALRCVMFRGANRSLAFRPEDGMQVLAAGYIGLYERDGVYQLYVEHMEPGGVGALYAAFEQLKGRLEAEGLFAQELKKPLPSLPRRVGIVTSPTGAALQDIIKVARRRFPRIDLVLCPVAVQGEGAAQEIARGITLLDRHGHVDVIIVGRGGGSLEDLWAFNEEVVARAIHAARTPVVSAVGHETDFTIADFVADVRAPTPTGAAMLVVPDEGELRRVLANSVTRLHQALRNRWLNERRRLERLLAGPVFQRPTHRILVARQEVDDLARQSRQGIATLLERRQAQLESLAGRLEALSPLAVLARGYSVTQRADDGRIIRRYDEVAVGDAVTVTLADGSLTCAVTDRREAAGKEGQP